jgi:hypothetical protein
MRHVGQCLTLVCALRGEQRRRRLLMHAAGGNRSACLHIAVRTKAHKRAAAWPNHRWWGEDEGGALTQRTATCWEAGRPARSEAIQTATAAENQANTCTMRSMWGQRRLSITSAMSAVATPGDGTVYSGTLCETANLPL